MRIPANLLSETTYTVNVSVTLIRGEGEEHALVVNKALAFMVYGEGVNADDGRHRKGVVNPTLEWTLQMEARCRPRLTHVAAQPDLWVIEPRQHGAFARLRELWSYRYLWWYFASANVTSLYRRSALGLAVAAAARRRADRPQRLVFGDMLNQAQKVERVPYFLFFLCGMVAWTRVRALAVLHHAQRRAATAGWSRACTFRD